MQTTLYGGLWLYVFGAIDLGEIPVGKNIDV